MREYWRNFTAQVKTGRGRTELPVAVVLAPVALRAERLLHPAPWLLALVSVVVYVAQPTPTRAELQNPADRRSAVLILLAGNLTSLAPVIEYALRDDWRPPPWSWWTAAGAAALLGGVALRLWALRSLGRFFTARNLST